MGNQVNRDQIHQVHQEDPDENSQGQRGNQLVVAVESVAHRVIDKLDNHFQRVYHAAGDAGLGLLGDTCETASKK